MEFRPNILLIHCHDLGQYLGCYGIDIETPNIDALAEEGALFENHFGTAPQCSPSRGSLMTGRYPHVNGLMGLAHSNWELHNDERILPQYLSHTDYETHLFGLQHITQDTDRMRYDHVHSAGNLYPGVSPSVHQANRARNVTSVFRSFLKREGYTEPFFASVGFYECHRAQTRNGRFGFEPEIYNPDNPDEIWPLPYLPDRWGIRHDLAEMRGMVYAIDEAVGKIRETLAETGLEDRSLVIFTTEHGIAFPRAKGMCYDAGIRAALICRGPTADGERSNGVNGGKRYSELISNVDVLPTILDTIGRDIPEHINGRSILPLISGEEFDGREQIFAEMTWHDMYNPVRAIRTKRYKYIRNFWHLPRVYLPADVYSSEAGREVRERFGVPPRPYEELYDLQQTPQEDENVVFEPRYQDVRRDLSRRLHRWMEDTGDPLLDGAVLPGDFDAIHRWPHQR